MKKFNRFFCLVAMCLIMVGVSGCGLIPLPNNLLWKDDLTSSEVLERASQEVNGLYGYQILTKGQVIQFVSDGSSRQDSNYSFEYDQKFNNRPQALHSQQKRLEQGKYTTTELYVVDGTAYISDDGSTWRKSQNQTDRIVLSQNPVNFLQFAREANGQGVTLNKEEGSYVITLDQNAGRAFLRQFYYEAKSGIQLSQSVEVSENDFQTEYFEQRIWIDDQTFLPKKMETDLAYKVQYLGRLVKNESRLLVTFQGEYNQQIQVPDHVKNSVGY